MLRLLSVMLPALFPVLVLWSLSSGAAAQNLFKCRIDGRLVYSGEPCKGVPSTAVEVPEAPRPDPAYAKELKRQEAALAVLEKQRKAREKLDERDAESDARIAAVRRQRCDKLQLQKKWAIEAADNAAGLDKEPLREKAERVSEYVATECPG
jgi:hypothetical protein